MPLSYDTLHAFVALAIVATPPALCAAQPAGAPLPMTADAADTFKSRFPRNVADLRRIEAQVQRVAERALPATVAVFVGQSAGSGVIISPEGLVLTAAHVVGRAGAGRRLHIILPDGRSLPGRSLGANHDIDAGMIQLDDPPADLPFVPIAKSGQLRPGEWVVTTGQPGGVVDNRAPPIRLGRVLFSEDDLVCTDCTLVGGDSGGPLINMAGQVVGIHSSIGQEITHNFHVATTGFVSSWDRLLAGDVWGGRPDDRPLLGVTGKTEEGQCLITRVLSGLPADEAGIRKGDVVSAVDGRPISSFDELARIIFFKIPGTSVALAIKRGEVLTTIRVQVTSAAEIERRDSQHPE